MIDYQFILNPGPSALEIEEPIGFDSLELSVNRDDKLHGMQFEASTSVLKFYGKAADYLKERKRLEGVKANVIFQVNGRCEGETEYSEILTGRLNFGKYKDTCGSNCVVQLPWEADTCQLTLNSRYDQKVDIDKSVAFDNATALEAYPGLGFDIELSARELIASIDGRVADEGDVNDIDISSIIGSAKTYVRPTYAVERYNSIKTGNLQAFSTWESTVSSFTPPISPQVLYEDSPDCFAGTFNYSLRMKGRISTSDSGGVLFIKLLFITWDGEGNIFNDGTTVEEVSILDETTESPFNIEFDESLNGTIALDDNVGLYAVISIDTLASGHFLYQVIFDSETFFTFEAPKSCPPTVSKSYMVHETLSRAVEAITNGCMRVKSSYYGRIDSKPFAFPSDGCGGLRMFTSGLYIRQAEEPNFFASVKELIEGLSPIDNIGMGVEEDIVPGKSLLRIEKADYFYQNIELLRLDFIPEATTETEGTKHYSKVNAGYKNWEVTSINGLDEFNSTREYRTTIDTVSSTLELISELVTGSYPIEVTRQQSFAESGGADTKYDNNIFLISLERMAYGYKVEQGGIDNPENIFSPETVYNWRLRPIYNLMRWYKSILPAFASMGSEAQLLFNAGTGNITAAGEQSSDRCKLENTVMAENADIYVTKFKEPADYLPLWKNDFISFNYPLSLEDYNKIKANPYGYISFQCGTGEWDAGWVKEVKFQVAKGSATFTLRKKYA